MVFPETSAIILEAKKKYEAFCNFYDCLDKKVTAFQIKKASTFQEKHDLNEEYRTEHMKGIKERKRFLLLEKRNIGIDPTSSRTVEMDFAEMKELEKTLKPSDDRIKEIKERIETLKFAETRQALNLDIDIAQSMYEDVIWLLQKASLYESAHSAQDELKNERLVEMKKRGVIPQYEGYFKPSEKDLWKSLAEAEFKKRQKTYYENLEKISHKRKLEKEKAERKRQKQRYKEWEERQQEK